MQAATDTRHRTEQGMTLWQGRTTLSSPEKPGAGRNPRNRPARTGRTSACNDAPVSYDLAVWDGNRPADDRQARSRYDERYLESDDVLVPPAPRIVAYVDTLVARYPDDVDRNVVWASPPVTDEASGPIVYLLMAYSKGRGSVRVRR